MRAGYLAALGLTVIFAALWLAADSKPAPKPQASGDLEYRQGTYAVRLTEEPCPFSDVAVQLESEGVPPAKRASITERSRTHTACWLPDGAGEILTQDQDGKGGSLPQEWFKRGS